MRIRPLVLALVLALASPPLGLAQKGRSPEPQRQPAVKVTPRLNYQPGQTSVNNLIAAVTAAAVMSSNLQGTRMSPSLEQTTANHLGIVGLGESFIVAMETSPEVKFRRLRDGGVFKFQDNWSPLISSMPTVEFRSGEVGLTKGEAFAKEGTMARIQKQNFVFRGGRWQENR